MLSDRVIAKIDKIVDGEGNDQTVNVEIEFSQHVTRYKVTIGGWVHPYPGADGLYHPDRAFYFGIGESLVNVEEAFNKAVANVMKGA